jgi:hypothetical protein
MSFVSPSYQPKLLMIERRDQKKEERRSSRDRTLTPRSNEGALYHGLNVNIDVINDFCRFIISADRC